jgi:hypothetical protein
LAEHILFDSDKISAVTLRTGEGEGTDPDTWTGWSDNGSGSKGTDYEHDTNGGYSRLRDLTTSGRAYTRFDAVNSADVKSFGIIRGITHTESIATNDSAYSYHHAYYDGSNYRQILLAAESGGNWWVVRSGGNSDTGKAYTSEADIFVYVTDGKAAVWFGGEASPVWSGTPVSPATAMPFHTGLICGRTDQTGAATTTLKSILSGGMATS